MDLTSYENLPIILVYSLSFSVLDCILSAALTQFLCGKKIIFCIEESLSFGMLNAIILTYGDNGIKHTG